MRNTIRTDNGRPLAVEKDNSTITETLIRLQDSLLIRDSPRAPFRTKRSLLPRASHRGVSLPRPEYKRVESNFGNFTINRQRVDFASPSFPGLCSANRNMGYQQRVRSPQRIKGIIENRKPVYAYVIELFVNLIKFYLVYAL